MSRIPSGPRILVSRYASIVCPGDLLDDLTEHSSAGAVGPLRPRFIDEWQVEIGRACLLLHERESRVRPRIADARRVSEQLSNGDRTRGRSCLVGAGGQVDLANHLGFLASRQILRHVVVEANFPSSTSIITPTEVTALVIEAMLKIASLAIGVPLASFILPKAS